MSNTSSGRTLFCTIIIAVAVVGWGCAPESSVEPTTGPALDLATAATYTIRDLGSLPGGSSAEAFAINNAGAVVGYSGVAGGRFHAFVWKNGVMRDLGTLAGGESQANAINDDGVIVGWSRVASGAMRAVRWQNGVKRNLGTLGGRNSEARGINIFGVIVGWSQTASGAKHAFVWKNGVMTDIGTMGGQGSQANGINRAGAVVGQSTTASGEGHAFKWKEGMFNDLGTRGTQFSAATAINTKGQIVGFLGPPSDGQGEELDMLTPFLYYQELMTLLPARRPTSRALAISPTGIVVGMTEDVRAEVDGAEDPWVWENGTYQNLPELVPTAYSTARGINLAGHIVGTSHGRAVLWRRQ